MKNKKSRTICVGSLAESEGKSRARADNIFIDKQGEILHTGNAIQMGGTFIFTRRIDLKNRHKRIIASLQVANGVPLGLGAIGRVVYELYGIDYPLGLLAIDIGEMMQAGIAGFTLERKGRNKRPVYHLSDQWRMVTITFKRPLANHRSITRHEERVSM